MKWNGIVSRINLLNCHAVRFMDVCTWITTGRLNGIDETYVDETPISLCAHIHWLKWTSATPDELKNWMKNPSIEVYESHLGEFIVQLSQAGRQAGILIGNSIVSLWHSISVGMFHLTLFNICIENQSLSIHHVSTKILMLLVNQTLICFVNNPKPGFADENHCYNAYMVTKCSFVDWKASAHIAVGFRWQGTAK